jgi:hypothetical protein
MFRDFLLSLPLISLDLNKLQMFQELSIIVKGFFSNLFGPTQLFFILKIIIIMQKTRKHALINNYADIGLAVTHCLNSTMIAF